jgi:hypothetical protein
MGTSNIIFRDGLFRKPAPMAAGGAVSENISCNNLNDPSLSPGQQTRGSLTAGALVFPSGWVTSNITFTGYLDDTFTNGFELYLGAPANTPYTIPACLALTMVPLNISIFSNVKYFKVNSITPQSVGAIMTLILFPLEQLSA